MAAATIVLALGSSGGAAADSTIELRVMSFNIFYGGDELNLQTRPTGSASTAGENADNPTASTCSAGLCGNGHYLLYTYTHNTIEGSTTFDANSFAGWKTWDQIGTGTYQIRLLLDDGYRSAAVSPPFKIVHP